MLTFIAAELLFLLVRSQDLKTLVKQEKQRTSSETHRVARGLLRSILLEVFIFVPASTTLLLFLAPLLISYSQPPIRMRATYVLLGIASYGFPFATVRIIITRIALNTLREFAALSPPENIGNQNNV